MKVTDDLITFGRFCWYLLVESRKWLRWLSSPKCATRLRINNSEPRSVNLVQPDLMGEADQVCLDS